MPNVSVIIPTYNRIAYLTQAVDSVLRQDYKNYEIIVVDDGSTDGTQSCIKKYIRKYPSQIVYIYQDNRGPAAARNAGIAHARGEFVAFLDSDDLWLPDKLNRQMKLFYERPDIDLVYGAYDIFDESGIISRNDLSKFYASLPEGNVFNELFLRCFISSSIVVIKKRVFDHIGGFDENMRIGEDYDFYLRAAKEYMIACVHDVVARHRQHKGNIMKTDKLNPVPSEISVIKNFANRNPDILKLMPRRLWRKRLSQPYFDIAYNCLQQGDRQLARYFLIGAFKEFPFRIVYYKYFLITFFPKLLCEWLKNIMTAERLGKQNA